MISSEVQRTLVKSPPELWTELSDPASLSRHLGEFGEIRITRIEPEQTVEWEADDATGTVLIKPSGWGTRVTLSVTRELPAAEHGDAEPAADADAQPGAQPQADPEPQADADPQADVESPLEVAQAEEGWSADADLQPEHRAEQDLGEPEPELDDAEPELDDPEPEIAAEAERWDDEEWEYEPEPEPEPRRSFLARLFRRHSRRSPVELTPHAPADGHRDGDAEEQPLLEEPLEAYSAQRSAHTEEWSADEAPEWAAAGWSPATAQGEEGLRPPQPATAAAAAAAAAAEAAAAAAADSSRHEHHERQARYDEQPPCEEDTKAAQEPAQDEEPAQEARAADLSAELKAAEEIAAEEVTALLTSMLDRLGTAHHRPFSRA
jgi:hypothetical protein